MAGSYRHCEKTGAEGEFIGGEFTDMIENLGDAHEACEMMFWMIQYLADNGWTNREAAIKRAEEAYYETVRGERINPYWSD